MGLDEMGVDEMGVDKMETHSMRLGCSLKQTRHTTRALELQYKIQYTKVLSPVHASESVVFGHSQWRRLK